MTVTPSQRLRRSPVGQVGVAVVFGLTVAWVGPSVMAALGDESTPVELCEAVGSTGVSGTVTESGSGDQVDGAWVAVLRTTDFTVAGGGAADAGGDYFAEVAPGSYYLYVVDPSGAHTAGFHGAPATVTVTAGNVTDADPAMAPTRGSVTATVTETGSGNPIPGVWGLALSTAVGSTGATERVVFANGAGQLALGGLRAGNHFVGYVDPMGAHTTRFFPNSPNVPLSTPVAVTAGNATAANASLPVQTPTGTGSVISGTITEQGTDTPLAWAMVLALRAPDFQMVRGAVTNGAGQYSLDVTPGAYKLAILDSTGRHNMEWYDNQPNTGLANAASVTAPGIANAALDANTGTMAGTVTDDPTGDRVRCAWVLAIGPSGPAGGAITAPDGTYTISGLAPGTYRAAFLDPVRGRALEYWNNHPDVITSDTFNITASNLTTIDAGLRFPIPANDAFANAQTVTGGTGTATGTNTGASKESGEPNHGGNTGGRSIWYAWTAPSTGTARFQTCGSDYDTTLAVYTGAVVNNLTALAGNDDHCGLQSRIEFPVTSGTTYRIAVDGYSDGYSADDGQVALSWSITAPPPLQVTGGDQA